LFHGFCHEPTVSCRLKHVKLSIFTLPLFARPITTASKHGIPQIGAKLQEFLADFWNIILLGKTGGATSIKILSNLKF